MIRRPDQILRLLGLLTLFVDGVAVASGLGQQPLAFKWSSNSVSKRELSERFSSRAACSPAVFTEGFMRIRNVLLRVSGMDGRYLLIVYRSDIDVTIV